MLAILFNSVFFIAGGYFFITSSLLTGFILSAIAIFLCNKYANKRKLSIDLEPRVLIIKRTFFGLSWYKRDIVLYSPDQFSFVGYTFSSKEGEYFSLFVYDGGETVFVMKNIKGRHAVEALVEKINQSAFKEKDS